MSKFKVFAKYIFKDCYKKFLTDYIIFDDGLEDTIKNNSLPISQMTEEQKIKLLDSLEIYSNYNEDFSRIIKKKILNQNAIVNIESIKEDMNTEKDGYTIFKAKSKLIIKYILIILLLLYSTIDFYANNKVCLDIEADEVDENYWLFEGKKYKVINYELQNDYFLYFNILKLYI